VRAEAEPLPGRGIKANWSWNCVGLRAGINQYFMTKCSITFNKGEIREMGLKSEGVLGLLDLGTGIMSQNLREEGTTPEFRQHVKNLVKKGENK
jgi:hypothetical protein